MYSGRPEDGYIRETGASRDAVSVRDMLNPPQEELVNREGYLVAAPTRRGARRAIAIAAAALAVTAVVVTVFLAFAAYDPERVSTQPSLTAPPATAAAVNRSLASVVGDQTLRLELPEQPPRGLVVLFPDAQADPEVLLGEERAVALKNAGWALATSEFHGASWGSPTSSDDVRALLEWSRGQVGSGPVMFVSEGMGATTSLMAISRSVTGPVNCWFAVEPRTDLYAIAQADPAVEDQVVSAWGGVPTLDDLPLAITSSLPSDVVYRVGEVAEDASSVLQEDVAALMGALESAGLDAGVVPGDGRQPAVLVEVAEACTA